MLRVRFTSIMTATLTVGPAEAFFLLGGAMIEHPSGRRIAHLIGHQWRIADRHYLRIDCDGVPATLRFVGPHARHGELFGPYRNSHVADGMFYVDQTPIARYVENTDRWICTKNGRDWPVLVLEPATAVTTGRSS